MTLVCTGAVQVTTMTNRMQALEATLVKTGVITGETKDRATIAEIQHKMQIQQECLPHQEVSRFV